MDKTIDGLVVATCACGKTFTCTKTYSLQPGAVCTACWAKEVTEKHKNSEVVADVLGGVD